MNKIINSETSSEFDLETLTYEKFIEGRTVYSTKLKACSKGFSAHHIVPVCLQGKDRNDKNLDNRCIIIR